MKLEIIPTSVSNEFDSQLSSSWRAQQADLLLYQSPIQKLVSLFQGSTLPHIMVLGKSGAGKGTLSNMLVDKYGYVHISVGDINREENKRGTKLGLKIRALVENNKIVSPEMDQITFILLNRTLKQIMINYTPFILDNFPTHPGHVPFMEEFISSNNLMEHIITIVPDISDDEALSRLVNRQVCPSIKCGRIYNLNLLPPQVKGICDVCRSTLMTRIDDTPDVIEKKRLPFYRANILPVIRILQNKTETYVMSNIFEVFSQYLGCKLRTGLQD